MCSPLVVTSQVKELREQLQKGEEEVDARIAVMSQIDFNHAQMEMRCSILQAANADLQVSARV